MKTTINTTTAGQITINSTYKGVKPWPCMAENYNNHSITISCNGRRISFEYWGSMARPCLDSNADNLGALDCFLSEALSAKDSFIDFCGEFGYNTRSGIKVYKACGRSLAKAEKIFDGVDLYDLANEIRRIMEAE